MKDGRQTHLTGMIAKNNSKQSLAERNNTAATAGLEVQACFIISWINFNTRQDARETWHDSNWSACIEKQPEKYCASDGEINYTFK